MTGSAGELGYAVVEVAADGCWDAVVGGWMRVGGEEMGAAPWGGQEVVGASAASARACWRGQGHVHILIGFAGLCFDRGCARALVACLGFRKRRQSAR
jgi:hypothetical protein